MSSLSMLRFTADEYLEWERQSPTKNEFLMGEIIAMACGSLRHSLMIGNLHTEIGSRLKGGPCRVFNADLRVASPGNKSFFYPDLTVLCSPPQYRDGNQDTLTNPAFLVEVLTPSSRGHDLGMNWIYRQIPSLQEFLLVDSTVVEMEHYLRLANGDWQIHMIRGLDSTLRLESLGISIAVEEIYRNAETLPA